MKNCMHKRTFQHLFGETTTHRRKAYLCKYEIVKNISF